jgi:hypothetical protein
MIRLQDEAGNWVHEVIIDLEDETYCIDVSKYEVFAKLFEKDELIVKDLVDNYGFEIVK